MYWHVFVHGHHRIDNLTRYGQSIVVADSREDAEGLARVRFSAWLEDVVAHPAIAIEPIDGNLIALLLPVGA